MKTLSMRMAQIKRSSCHNSLKEALICDPKRMLALCNPKDIDKESKDKDTPQYSTTF